MQLKIKTFHHKFSVVMKQITFDLSSEKMNDFKKYQKDKVISSSII